MSTATGGGRSIDFAVDRGSGRREVYAAGCAIFPGVAPDPSDPRTVVVHVWERPG